MNAYNFKIVAVPKVDLSEEASIYVRERIDELCERNQILPLDDHTYMREKMNGSDFGRACNFAFRLADEPQYFSEIEVFDLNNNYSERLV